MSALKSELEAEHGMTGHHLADAVYDIASSHQHDQNETRSLYAEIVNRIVVGRTRGPNTAPHASTATDKGLDEEALSLYP